MAIQTFKLGKSKEAPCQTSDCVLGTGADIETDVEVSFDDDVLRSKGISLNPCLSSRSGVRTPSRNFKGCAEEWEANAESMLNDLDKKLGQCPDGIPQSGDSITAVVSGTITAVWLKGVNKFSKTSCGNTVDKSIGFSGDITFGIPNGDPISRTKYGATSTIPDGKGGEQTVPNLSPGESRCCIDCPGTGEIYVYEYKGCVMCGIPWNDAQSGKLLCKGTPNMNMVFDKCSHTVGEAIDNGYPTSAYGARILAAGAKLAAVAVQKAQQDLAVKQAELLAMAPDGNCGLKSVTIAASLTVS